MYKLVNNIDGVATSILKLESNGAICFALGSGSPEEDEYLKWLEEGNTPEPADGVSE